MNKYGVMALIGIFLLMLSSCNTFDEVTEAPKKYIFDNSGHILTGELYIDDVYYKVHILTMSIIKYPLA